MKKIKYILIFVLCFSLFGCAQKQEPYQEIDITAAELKEKIENKETFNFMVIRDNCEFCEALSEYVEQTKDEHPGIVLYVLDSTDYDFSRNEEEMLVSNTEDGQYFLGLCPYFLYTPTIYCVENGTITTSAIGFNSATKCLSIWGLDSFVDFDEAETIEFWEFIS